MINSTEIKEFWSWFEEVYSEFEEQLDNSFLISDLDNKVCSLGDFT